MSTQAHAAPDRGVIGRLVALWRGSDAGLRRRLITIYAFLISFHVLIWVLLLASSAKYPVLLGLAPGPLASVCATPLTLITSLPLTTRLAS